jgi:hypothetical protein
LNGTEEKERNGMAEGFIVIVCEWPRKTLASLSFTLRAETIAQKREK